MPDSSVVVQNSRRAGKVWSALPVRERLAWVRKLRRRIVTDSELLIQAIRADMGKPAMDALSGDILTTLEQLRYYENNATRILAQKKIAGQGLMFWGNRMWEHYEPRGVTLVISPWNYPFQLALVPVVTALIAGNSVILKPSEHASQTARALRNLFERIGFPAGVFALAEGDGSVAERLIDAGVDQVFFTGSQATGRRVAAQCANRLIPAILELGGKDAFIVRKDAHLERAARGAVYGAYLNSGQVCVGAKRILVQKDVFEEFLSLFKKEVSLLRVSRDQNSDIAPMQSQAQASRLEAKVREALAMGAQSETPFKVEAALFHPLLLSQVPKRASLYEEEVFGPVATIETYETDAEAVEMANSLPFGLGASIWSRDLKSAEALARQLEVGSCAINQVIVQIASPAGSFGGEKSSGIGRYHGPDGLYAFSRKKTIMVNRGRNKKEINWFPFVGKTYERLKWLIRLRHGTIGALLAALAAAGSLSMSANMGTLKVHVQSVQSAHGSMRYLLFHSADGFPDDKKLAFRGGAEKITSGDEVVLTLSDIPYGEYALSVYQDENDNQKLDKNFLGIPREPVGASNDPKGRMGPPRFSDSRFNFFQPEMEITIHLVHP